MFRVIRARLQQGYRTMKYPDGPPPELPRAVPGDAGHRSRALRRRLRPVRGRLPDRGRSRRRGDGAARHGPVPLLRGLRRRLPAGRAAVRPPITAWRRDGAKTWSSGAGSGHPNRRAGGRRGARMFGRSLKLRQVSAGGCNACEADANVLTTSGLGPRAVRHPVRGLAAARGRAPGHRARDGEHEAGAGEDLRGRAFSARRDRVGACAISGGPYRDHPEVCNGAAEVVPVDLFVPGCPPHP